MTRGQLASEMISVTGEVLETIRRPVPSAWVGSIRRPRMPLYAADRVVEVVERL
jgi:hypothetical protein